MSNFKIRSVDTISINTTETSVPINGRMCYLHNTGANKMYLSTATGVTTVNGWELKPDEKTPFPLCECDNLYMISATAVGTLKILYIDML